MPCENQGPLHWSDLPNGLLGHGQKLLARVVSLECLDGWTMLGHINQKAYVYIYNTIMMCIYILYIGIHDYIEEQLNNHLYLMF